MCECVCVSVWVGVGVLVCDQRTPLHVCVYAHNACVPWVYVCMCVQSQCMCMQT